MVVCFEFGKVRVRSFERKDEKTLIRIIKEEYPDRSHPGIYRMVDTIIAYMPHTEFCIETLDGTPVGHFQADQLHSFEERLKDIYDEYQLRLRCYNPFVIGYGIFSEYQGKQYAQDALQGFLHFVRSCPEYRTNSFGVLATICPTNAVSIHIVEKHGFELQGPMCGKNGTLCFLYKL